MSGDLAAPGLERAAAPRRRSAVFPLYEAAIDLGVPVVVTSSHVIGPDMSFAMPEYLQRVALAYPELTIVVGHACWPWTTQACALAARCHNVYLMPEFYMYVASMPCARDYVDAANGFLSIGCCTRRASRRDRSTRHSTTSERSR